MGVLWAAALIVCASAALAAGSKDDGYRGIWYSNQPSGDEYRYKYSGGLGTYCAKHIPMAVYAPAVNKTFFVYGGTKGLEDPKPLLEMIGCYDHAAGTVTRPTIICHKLTADAHHNPTVSLDSQGFVWVFVCSHGGRDAFIYKSRAPYSIEAFDQITQKEFSYAQPWHFDGFGFTFLFTRYTRGRELYVSTSRDGFLWTDDRKIAGFGGHYQVSWPNGSKLGTAFDWHPPVVGLNGRTNLYYIETPDHGTTWTTASGKKLAVPLGSPQNDAMVREYQKEGLLVYVKDLNYDKNGHPVILYVLGKGYESGPKHGKRTWTTARWTGSEWAFRTVTTGDHNYDTGALYIEPDGTWRVIGPTEPGPQAWCTGGEITMWTSRDQGDTWSKAKDLTAGSRYNHNHARRPLNANPGFYSFWADGNSLKPSESRLFFADRDGNVRMLPPVMTSQSAVPAKFEPGE